LHRRLQALHDAQPLHCRRAAADFYAMLHNWLNEPWAATSSGGDVVGYVVGDLRRGFTSELVADTPARAFEVACAWARIAEANATIHAPALHNELTEQLCRAAERAWIGHSANWRVFRWPEVLSALMRARARTAPLEAGRVVVRATEWKRSLRIESGPGGVECAWVDEPAEVTLPERDLLRVLTGPVPPSCLLADSGVARSLGRLWPLPLWISHPDHV
jgi:hypothetical protein